MVKNYDIAIYKEEGLFLKNYKLLKQIESVDISEVTNFENQLEIKIHEWKLNFIKNSKQQFEEISDYFDNVYSDIFCTLQSANQNKHIVSLHKIKQNESEITKGAMVFTVKVARHPEENLIRDYIQHLDLCVSRSRKNI
jgi:translation initiation factor 2 beta subunit (eIF-2beta)/eIF-5